MFEEKQKITAKVILKSRDEERKEGEYLPDLDVVIETARFFRDAGFRVTPNHLTLRLKGEIDLFQRMFNVSLNLVVNDAWGDVFVEVAGSLRIPEVLKDVLVTVDFNSEMGGNRYQVRRLLQAET